MAVLALNRREPVLKRHEEGDHAEQERQREEREAVRGAEGEGHVEGAGGEDRQLPRRVEPRREGVPQLELEEQLVTGRDDRAEEGRRPQGRQGDGCKALATASAGAHASGIEGVSPSLA